MKDLVFLLVRLIARVHDRLLTINDYFPTGLTDKQLHFVIFGLFGALLFALLYYPIRALVRRGRVAALCFLMTFLMVFLFAFAVEVGQFATGTGRMEVADITAGILGFLCIGALGALLVGALRLIRNWLRHKKDGD